MVILNLLSLHQMIFKFSIQVSSIVDLKTKRLMLSANILLCHQSRKKIKTWDSSSVQTFENHFRLKDHNLWDLFFPQAHGWEFLFFLLFKKIVKTKFTFYILHHLRKLKFTTFFLWSPLHKFLCLIIYSVLTKNDWTNFHWEYFCLNN